MTLHDVVMLVAGAVLGLGVLVAVVIGVELWRMRKDVWVKTEGSKWWGPGGAESGRWVRFDSKGKRKE
jgi:hypothetical protein